MRRDIRSLPLDSWPAADRQAWNRALGNDFDADEGGDAEGWRPPSKRNAIVNYGAWLGWLSREGLLGAHPDPAGRITRERVRAYRDSLFAGGARPGTVYTRLHWLGMMANVMFPAFEWGWVDTLANRAGRRPDPGKPPLRLVDPPEAWRAGLDLMDRAREDDGASTLERAIMFRDGLMLIVLVGTLIRVRALLSMDIDRHGADGVGEIRLTFEGDDTKAGQPQETCLPQEIRDYYVEYLGRWRPILAQGPGCGEAGTAFWLANSGQPMTAALCHKYVTRRTKAAFGFAVPPHKFRHSGATAIASDRPDLAYTIPTLLHHAPGSRATQYYNLAASLAASRRFGAHLEDEREHAREVLMRDGATHCRVRGAKR